MRGVGLDRSVRVLRVGARVPRDEVEHLWGGIPLHWCSYGGLDCLKCEHATQFFSDATQCYTLLSPKSVIYITLALI